MDCWRVFTFSFLHLNVLHLVLNVAGLVWLGGVVERRLGRIGVLAVFAVSAITSGIAGMLLGSVLPTTGIAVGASGAIYGLLAGSLILVHRSPAAASGDRRLRRVLLNVAVVAVIISFVPGVSLAGHLGGFIGGAIVARSIDHRVNTFSASS
jgi:membrane associated rhomboid family serine protease